ncbi:MAG: hypothetical protein OEY28_13920, partial [Nitrospira sp.]|nr:hypothetical protein [Nitrospira sp.]
GQPMPGARAHYSPLDSIIITWDDREALEGSDNEWFNQSVIIHETFHMLSDHYGANPQATMEERQDRARWASILVQEGITDSVAGFERDDSGTVPKYDFLKLNHIRLRDFKAVCKGMKDKLLFRPRDMIKCMHYGQCSQVGFERWKELELDPLRGMFLAQQGAFVSWFYAFACQGSYFFHNFEKDGKYIYRDKWWEFLKRDYTGEIDKSGYENTDTIKVFKEVFGISSDSQWDEMDAHFVEFTMALTAEDVGGPTAEPEVEGDGEEGEDDEGDMPEPDEPETSHAPTFAPAGHSRGFTPGPGEKLAAITRRKMVA